MSKLDLRGKTVVITGASGGICSEAAVRFGMRGAKVVLSGRNREALDKAAERVKATGAEAHIVPADVTREGEVKALVAKAIELTGGLDVMLLGAGYGVAGDVAHITIDAWRKQMDTNFWGVMYGFYAALPHFMKQGYGQYIIISSVAGRIALPLNAPYCASKAALWAFADSSRAELKQRNIDMLIVYPNFTKTEFQGHIESPDLTVPRDLAWKMYGQTPEHVAEQIVRASEKRKGEIIFSAMAKIGVRLMPLSYHIAEWGRRISLPMTKRLMGGDTTKSRN